MKDFDNIDYLSRILNNQIVPVRNVADTRQDHDKSLREKYYSVTLGDMMKGDMNLLSLLSNQHLYTFSPPAFGLTKRPGDNFTPWQCVLAEEAPPLATTVYRQAVDKEDFEYLIDEGGKLHESKGVTSVSGVCTHYSIDVVGTVRCDSALLKEMMYSRDEDLFIH
ncbi:unnamed protein product [Trichobilharzia regenti]|nr:unnamed protein product [Trichobilharzia regenti]